MLVAETAFVVPVSTGNRQYFVGISDDALETTTLNPAINITSAYTTNVVAADSAGFILSSLGTSPTVWKYASAKASTASTVDATTIGVTATFDCYTVCRVEVDSSGNIFYYQSISGSSSLGRVDPVYQGSKAAAITTTTSMLPYFAAAATTSAAVEWEIDYMFGACAR
jgi:hypothetical protein